MAAWSVYGPHARTNQDMGLLPYADPFSPNYAELTAE